MDDPAKAWDSGYQPRGQHVGISMEDIAAPIPREIRHDHARSVRPERARSVRRFRGRTFRNDLITVEEVTQAVSATLSNTQAKQIQSATGGSIRAAQNVKEGLNCMSLTNFINAARAIPELKSLAMDMLDCEAETDPEFVRGLHHLINAHLQRNGGE